MSTSPSSSAPSPTAKRVTELPQNQPFTFEVRPDAPVLKAIAAELGLDELRKLRFAGQIEGVNRADWRLSGKLGATVVQPCVVSLDPVTTRIDTPVERLFLRDFEAPDEDEVEMDSDERTEQLEAWIDPEAVMIEALSLALPMYPRKQDAALTQTLYAEGDVTPMTDAEARPFAKLAEMRDQLAQDSSSTAADAPKNPKK